MWETVEMFKDFEFNKPTDYEITEINGVTIPDDYLSFMHEHNGGEGGIGENGYMQLVKLEELADFNEDYEISKWHQDIFIFGTDLGGILFGYDSSKSLYCSIDSCSITEEDTYHAGKTFAEFIQAVEDGEL